MWEYERLVIKFVNGIELTNELNLLGENKWEVIHYQEQKPNKYGGEYKTIVLVKRLKPIL